MTDQELKDLQTKLAKFEAKAVKDKEQRAEYNKRRNAKNQIIIRKAVEAGLTVTEEEIDAALK